MASSSLFRLQGRKGLQPDIEWTLEGNKNEAKSTDRTSKAGSEHLV